MSQRTKSILEFIRRFLIERKISPTLREIGVGCAIPSTSTVHYYLVKLERLGLIKRYSGVARGIVLL
jgi:repressor LexA